MGKRIKSKIDWSLDKGNQVGDVIMLTQYTQTRLGVVGFLGQAPLYNYYAGLVNETHDKSKVLHEQVLELPISQDSNSRFLIDDHLLEEIYNSGSQLIICLYLMFEHFATHAGILTLRSTQPSEFVKFEQKELKDKIKQVLELLGISEQVKSDGYGVLFTDIERIRHSINHPKSNNIYSVDADQWDEVPIAWFVSGKHLDACSKTINLYNEMHSKLGSYVAEHKTPGTIKLDGPISFTNNSFTKKSKPSDHFKTLKNHKE